MLLAARERKYVKECMRENTLINFQKKIPISRASNAFLEYLVCGWLQVEVKCGPAGEKLPGCWHTQGAKWCVPRART